jgi:hypothetical protein
MRLRGRALSLFAPALLACGGQVVFERDGTGGAGGQGAGQPGTASTTKASTAVSSVQSSDSVSVGVPVEDILEQLNDIPGMDVYEVPAQYPGYRDFAGTFMQPANHDDPNGQQFPQTIYISHRDVTAPMVLFNTGYALFDTYLSEPAVIANANQLAVEQRFFAPSIPENANWQLLNIQQAAKDHHRLVEALAPIYTANWLSTGGSKGGMTSIYHRRFFPEDIDGTIAYVAPLSYGLGDPRYITFLDEVGTTACVDALKAFQIDALSRRAALVPTIDPSQYTYWDTDAAFDFAVMGIRFAIWQYSDASACDWIPSSSASDADVFVYLETYNSPSGTADYVLDFFEPYYFQAATQLGDPGSDESYLAPWITVPLGLQAPDFVQPGPTKQMVFQPEVMPDIQNWVLNEGSQLLFVYGENDPWTAGAFEISGLNETMKLTAPSGNHGAGISSLVPSDQSVATDAVLLWAGLIDSPPPAPNPVDLEVARLARLADSAPPGKLRARFEEEARALFLTR